MPSLFPKNYISVIPHKTRIEIALKERKYSKNISTYSVGHSLRISLQLQDMTFLPANES